MKKTRSSIVAVCVHLSLNVCNEIMKRETDFTPRTAEWDIMVDWPRILGCRSWLGSVPLPVFPSPSVLPGDAWQSSSRSKWKTMTFASKENLAPTQNGRNGAASQERVNKFWEMNVPWMDGEQGKCPLRWSDVRTVKSFSYSHNVRCVKVTIRTPLV